MRNLAIIILLAISGCPEIDYYKTASDTGGGDFMVVVVNEGIKTCLLSGHEVFPEEDDAIWSEFDSDAAIAKTWQLEAEIEPGDFENFYVELTATGDRAGIFAFGAYGSETFFVVEHSLDDDMEVSASVTCNEEGLVTAAWLTE